MMNRVEGILEQGVNQSLSEAPSQETSLSNGNGPPGLTLVDILLQLAGRKWLIAKTTGAFFFIGVILSFLLPVRYTAVTKITQPRQTPSAASFFNPQTGIATLADLGGSGGLLFKDPNALYIGLLQSTFIQDSIINEFGLLAEYHAKDMSIARKKLRSNTSIASERSTLIAISVTDYNKNRAADIANAYVDQLRILSKTISVTDASRRRVLFENQLKIHKQALSAAEVAFRNIQQSKGVIQLDTQANTLVSMLAGLQAKIAAKEVELQALRSYSTEQNSVVQVEERELAAIKEEASQLEKQSGSSGISDLSLKQIPKTGMDYIRAQRNLQYQQSLVDLLRKQCEAARLDEEKDAIVIQIVESAVPPDRKSAPNRRMLMILCTFIGLATGCILALLARWKDLFLSTPEGAEAYLRLKCAFIGNEPQRLIVTR
jgi:uncharacterized protein involved in exopolysaccharide biosynthesis